MWSGKVSAKNIYICGQHLIFFFLTPLLFKPTSYLLKFIVLQLVHDPLFVPPMHKLKIWATFIPHYSSKKTKTNIHPPCQTFFENTWRLGLKLFCVPNIHVVNSKFTLSICNAGISGKITRIFQTPSWASRFKSDRPKLFMTKKHLHSMKNIARNSTKRNCSNNASMRDARVTFQAPLLFVKSMIHACGQLIFHYK